MIFEKARPVYDFWSKWSENALFDQNHRLGPVICDLKIDSRKDGPVYPQVPICNFQEA